MERRHAYRYPVGKSARYSNVGYLALGQVITAAARMPFEAYVEQSVLRPVGMDHTGFTYSAAADRATGYVKAPRVADPVLRRLLPHGVVGNRHGPYLALNPFYVDGPAYGGLVGNVMDAGRFLRMHLRDGEIDGHRILDPRTARSMRSIVHPGKPFNHGTGWFRRPTKSPGKLGGALRHRRRLLEPHAPLPRPRPRRRHHDQQHHKLRLRASPRPPGRCVMVVIAIIALIRGIRMINHQRTAPAARRKPPSRLGTEWIPPLLNYPARASR